MIGNVYPFVINKALLYQLPITNINLGKLCKWVRKWGNAFFFVTTVYPVRTSRISKFSPGIFFKALTSMVRLNINIF